MFRKLCAIRVTGTRFYISGHDAKFFKKEYLSKVFGAKVKKTSVVMS